jgi:hypothetical protein
MKLGDLVRFRSSYPDWPVGMIIEQHPTHGAHPQSEFRVRWLDDAGKDVSWVRRKDLEVLSASR